MPENFVRDMAVLSMDETCKVFSQLLQISAEQVAADIDAWSVSDLLVPAPYVGAISGKSLKVKT